MNSNKLNIIIKEEIDKVLSEDWMTEKKKESSHSDLVSKYFPHRKKKKKSKKLRKLAHGGKEYYDYEDYERKDKKISTGDASSIRNTIDTEKTNIAAVARELFPDHTEEGAQSQFRKIIKGERPMTKGLATKIEKMISAGQIAVK